jgi:hypothetical protein
MGRRLPGSSSSASLGLLLPSLATFLRRRRLGSFGNLGVEVATGRHNPFYTEYDQCVAQGTPYGAQRGARLSKKVECTFFAPVWLCGAFSSFPIYGF